MRNFLYRLASILGDINAARKGKYSKRIVRKQVYKTTGSLINRLLK